MQPGFRNVPVGFVLLLAYIMGRGTQTDRGYNLVKHLTVLSPFELNLDRELDSTLSLNHRWGQRL